MNTLSLARFGLVLSCALLSVQTSFAAANHLLRYRVTDLGAFSHNPYQRSLRINNSGTVAGVAYGGPTPGLFLYDAANGRVELGLPPERVNAFLLDFNDAGQVLGNAGFTYSSGVSDNSFLYNGLSFADLPVVPEASFTFVQGINNHGDMVGEARYANGARRGFVYTGGQFFLLDGRTSENSAPINYAAEINDSRAILGYSYHTNGTELGERTIIVQNGEATDLGTLQGGSLTYGRFINSLGHVAGAASTLSNSNFHGFLYRDGAMIDLGLHFPVGLNNVGQMIGSRRGRPYLYTNGSWQRLGPLIRDGGVWGKFDLQGINDAGQIVATAERKGRNRLHAVLLTPEVQ